MGSARSLADQVAPLIQQPDPRGRAMGQPGFGPAPRGRRTRATKLHTTASVCNVVEPAIRAAGASSNASAIKPRLKFARDSLLEESGFEPSVPP